MYLRNISSLRRQTNLNELVRKTKESGGLQSPQKDVEEMEYFFIEDSQYFNKTIRTSLCNSTLTIL